MLDKCLIQAGMLTVYDVSVYIVILCYITANQQHAGVFSE